VAIGPSLPIAVFLAVYTKVNAKPEAMTIGGPVTFLEPEEGAIADKTNAQVVGRPWGCANAGRSSSSRLRRGQTPFVCTGKLIAQPRKGV
jgi:hypothetical protein